MTPPPETEGCFFCGRFGDLRPYGPGGSPLCFTCLKATPEREAAAGRAFEVQLEASEIVGQGVTALGGNGPRPSTQEEREMLERAWLDGSTSRRVLPIPELSRGWSRPILAHVHRRITL